MSKTFVKNQINLLEETIYPLGVWDKLYLWVINIGRFMMMIIEIVTIVLFFIHIVYDEQLINLREHIQNSIYTLDTLKADEAYIRHTLNVLKSIQTLEAEKKSMYDLNNKFYALIPGGILLQNVSIDNMQVSFSGIALGYDPLKTMLDNIKGSALVESGSLRVNTSQKNINEVKFNISFKFKD